MTTYNDQPTLLTGARVPPTPSPTQPAAAACLQASLLLRRRIHRHPDRGLDDDQVLLTVCHLLDALSRGLADSPTATGAVERATLRLADQLRRLDAKHADPDRSARQQTSR